MEYTNTGTVQYVAPDKPLKDVETRGGPRDDRRRPSAEQADGDDNWVTRRRGDSRSRSRSRRGDNYDEERQRGRGQAESTFCEIDSERAPAEAGHSRGDRLVTAEVFRRGFRTRQSVCNPTGWVPRRGTGTAGRRSPPPQVVDGADDAPRASVGSHHHGRRQGEQGCLSPSAPPAGSVAHR